MKAAFNISPSASEINTLHLLVETGAQRISFTWFNKAPFVVKGLITYNHPEQLTGVDIKNIISSHESLMQGTVSTTICYDFKESVLVPGKYNYNSMSEDALALMYGRRNDVVLNNDFITSANIYNHYRIPSEMEQVFSEKFPRADIFHSTSLQLEQLTQEKDLLYCILYQHSLKTILFKEGVLQVVQQFNYTTPEDVAYHLLNTCEQFSVKPSEVDLRLSGMVDEQSRLYGEMYNYFQNISFQNVADGIYVSEEIKALPAHFFSHLTALAICVS